MNEIVQTEQKPADEQIAQENSYERMKRFQANTAMQMEKARRASSQNNLLFPTPTAF